MPPATTPPGRSPKPALGGPELPRAVVATARPDARSDRPGESEVGVEASSRRTSHRRALGEPPQSLAPPVHSTCATPGPLRPNVGRAGARLTTSWRFRFVREDAGDRASVAARLGALGTESASRAEDVEFLSKPLWYSTLAEVTQSARHGCPGVERSSSLRSSLDLGRARFRRCGIGDSTSRESRRTRSSDTTLPPNRRTRTIHHIASR